MMDNDNIEILDLEDEVSVTNIDSPSEIDKKEEVKGGKMESRKTKKRRLKKGLFQTIFCLLSLAFIIGCCIFYGNRLIKYYKIYNPKTESGEAGTLLSSSLLQNSSIVFEGEGLYKENGIYAYKGEEVNNYVKYSNMLWRIVRTNTDGSLEIILDDYINILAWDFGDKEYINSDIHKYLNDILVSQLDTSYLVNTSICTDRMESIDKFSCEVKDTNSFVKLLPANDYLNSVIDKKSFVAKQDELVWLGTTAKKGSAWLANEGNISSAETSNTYFVKPVVTLKNSTQLISGDGSKEKPFIIEKDSKEIKLGSYLTIDEDTWVVYEKNNDVIKLVYNGLYNKGLSTYRFDTEKLDFDPERKNSLAELLNTEFYESLSYKDKLLDFDVYTATYTKSYKNAMGEKVTVKVGIPSALDLKFDNSQSGYYISNKSPRTRIYYYRNDLISSRPGVSRPYKPTISIKVPKVKDGDGTLDNPFKVEV